MGAHFGSSGEIPGVAFPGQVINPRDFADAFAGHDGDPLTVALLRRAGVRAVADLDVSDTRVGQPATYVTGLLRARRRFGSAPVPVVLGHSLGEITALAFSGAIDPYQGLDLVFELGELGHQQDLARSSSLVVLAGLDRADVDWVSRLAVAESCEVLEAAGFNAPLQTILCGDRKAAEVAAELAERQGGRAVLLPIRGAYHSSLMADLLQRWGDAIGRVEFGTPRIPIVSSVDARCNRTADGLAELLTRWLLLPVRWADAVAAAQEAGAAALWDAGPGTILRSLAKRGSALPFV